MDEMSIEQARLKLGEVVDRARIAEQHTRITRQGKPAAVVVSGAWYERDALVRSEAIHALANATALLQALRKIDEWEELPPIVERAVQLRERLQKITEGES